MPGVGGCGGWRYSRSQVGLFGRGAGARTCAGAFRCWRGVKVKLAGRNVLLVDDVGERRGRTASEAARAPEGCRGGQMWSWAGAGGGP